MEQRTEEWYNIRLGRVTASRVSDVLAQTRTGPSTSRKNYMMELMVERMTNRKQESYTNTYMQHGIDNEPRARAAYEKVIDGLVHEIGSRYQAQVQAQMACTERLWCDFVSYDPRMPDDMQMVRIRVKRDNQYIENMESEVEGFLGELDELVATVSSTKIPL